MINEHPYVKAVVGIREAERVMIGHLCEIVLNSDKCPERHKGNHMLEPSRWLMWDCPTSPIGTCMYDSLDDRAHDNCIFCHLPEERK